MEQELIIEIIAMNQERLTLPQLAELLLVLSEKQADHYIEPLNN